jgi:hypothetical protein
MRCLFCKQDSSRSVGREHIIPESLGNTTQVLPPGVVCDGCNNYFARKVERPFLQAAAILQLRFQQALPNKKGRVPKLRAVMGGLPLEVIIAAVAIPMILLVWPP